MNLRFDGSLLLLRRFVLILVLQLPDIVIVIFVIVVVGRQLKRGRGLGGLKIVLSLSLFPSLYFECRTSALSLSLTLLCMQN